MASRTTNYGLIKPDYDDTIDVAQLNSNSDIIDTQLDTKVKKSGDVMTGTLEVPTVKVNNVEVTGNIYNTDDEFSIYGYKDTYDSTPTLDLTSGTRSSGVYAQLSVPFKDRKNYLQLNGNSGNLNLSIDGGLWFSRDFGNHQTYIARSGNSAQLILNDSDYVGQEGRFVGTCDDGTNKRWFYFDSKNSGTFAWDGIRFKSTQDLSRFQSRDAESYVETHTNGDIYVKGAMQSVSGTTFTIKSPTGVWFNIADDGDAHTALGTVMVKSLQQTPNDSYVQGDVWKFADGMMIQSYTVWNGASWVDKRYVTLWQPFLSNYYTVVGGMRTHIGQSDIRINADYRCATYNQTATGFWIGCDNLVDTTFIAIGRWK